MKAWVLTLEEVQVHTMLATVHDDAYSEYLDLKSMERKGVRGWAGMPDATSRDWLKHDEGEP